MIKGFLVIIAVLLAVNALQMAQHQGPKYAPSKPGFTSTNTQKQSGGGTQPNQYGTNNNQYSQYGTNNNQYRPYGTNNNQYSQYGTNNNQYRPYGTNNNQYSQYGTNNNQYRPAGGVTVGGKSYSFSGPEKYECEENGRISYSSSCYTQQNCYQMLMSYRTCKGKVYRSKLRSRY